MNGWALYLSDRYSNDNVLLTDGAWTNHANVDKPETFGGHTVVLHRARVFQTKAAAESYRKDTYGNDRRVRVLKWQSSDQLAEKPRPSSRPIDSDSSNIFTRNTE